MVANPQDVMSRVLRLKRNKMSADVAREIVRWRFSDADKRHVAKLLAKNSEGTITSHELNDLHSLVALGEVLDLLHVEAELALRKKRPARAN